MKINNTRVYEASKLIDVNINSLLDLGCRDKALKTYFAKNIQYQGIDFEESENVLSHNLEKGIPYEDNSYDCICALDILEHLENIHFVLNEMKRVAKKEIIIALPNMYYYRFRLKYLIGFSLGAKYDLPTNKIIDRHRWITSYYNSKNLIENIFQTDEITLYLGKTSNIKVIAIFDKVLQKVFPNIASHNMFFRIRLQDI